MSSTYQPPTHEINSPNQVTNVSRSSFNAPSSPWQRQLPFPLSRSQWIHRFPFWGRAAKVRTLTEVTTTITKLQTAFKLKKSGTLSTKEPRRRPARPRVATPILHQTARSSKWTTSPMKTDSNPRAATSPRRRLRSSGHSSTLRLILKKIIWTFNKETRHDESGRTERVGSEASLQPRSQGLIKTTILSLDRDASVLRKLWDPIPLSCGDTLYL